MIDDGCPPSAATASRDAPPGAQLSAPESAPATDRRVAPPARPRTMIVETQARYAIDRDRVFVTGFSGGAQFAHRFAFRYPSQICGVSVMSAGSYDPPPRRARLVPFAVSVGETDTERTALALWFARELKRAGYEVRYETFPGIGHHMSGDAIELTMDLFRDVALAH